MKRIGIAMVVVAAVAVAFLIFLVGSANAGCIGVETGTDFNCCDTITESCTFNADMPCPTGKGLVVGADGITIDGAGFTLDGITPGDACTGSGAARTGIYSYYHNSVVHDNVVIKNLTIKNFCNGIFLRGDEDDHVDNYTIENCAIYHNGRDLDGIKSNGIKMLFVYESEIKNCEIYNNTGGLGCTPPCENGGSGIFMYAGDYNFIANNKIYNNRKGGYFTKAKPTYTNITNNTLWGNGQGGIILRCKACEYNLIEHNNASYNYGTGIFIGGPRNTIRNNLASYNKNGSITGLPGTLHGGGGINLGRSDGSFENELYNNTVCGNEYLDVHVCLECTGNTGDDNVCDTTYNYNDTGTIGCTYDCLPDLEITEKTEEWVVAGSTYNITYTVKNIGSKEANASTTSIKVDGTEEATDSVPELAAGASHTNTLGPFTMSGDSDTIEVCADCENNVTECNETNNCMENEFCVCGCVGATQIFVCGDTVTESCVFNCNMTCDSKYGLKIGTNGITIDGGGYTLDGVSSGACDGFGIQRCGIYNKAHDDIVIKNLEVKNFCNGIYFKFDADVGDEVERTTIENCEIHHNGGDTGCDNSVHGIKAIGVFDSVIRNCTIHHNTGKGTSCEAGGNGIFLKGIDGYGAWNNTITENEIYGNRKGGFFTKMMCEVTEVSYNKLWGNGQGGIILRCKKTTTHDIHHNNASCNYGDGIFVGGPDNTLRDNVVNNNIAGLNISGTDVVGDGDGIDMGRNDGSYSNELYNNTVCGNEGTDIDTYDAGSGTTGANNTCDTCSNYNDEGEICCTYNCPGEMDLIVIDKSESWVDTLNKTYNITYTIKNAGNSTAGESTTGIYIDESLVASVPLGVIGPGENCARTVGPFTMSGNEDTIEVCADVESVVNETDETNNCLENVFTGVVKPDLEIVGKTEEWVSLENKTYNITYTVKNIGNAAASESTMSILIDGTEATTDSVGVLALGESYTNTLGSFNMSGESDTVRICADKNNDVNESNEDNNCQQNTFEHPDVPDLVISEKFEVWIASNETFNSYNITYTIKNVGNGDANESTTSILIDRVEVANDSVGTLEEGESCTNTLGPFTMSGENDTVRICADKNNDVDESNEDNNCSENVFEYSEVGCVAEDGTLFRCGNTVTKNCTFNGTMNCSTRYGLIVGADNVTINGADYMLERADPGDCAFGSSVGIYNHGHDDAVIKNLEVKKFCIGMYLDGDGDYVYRNTIENCNVHHNGNATSGGNPHGITLKSVYNSTIRNNSIHNTVAHMDPNPGCEDGGNGIFLYKGDYNLITRNKFYNNTKGGFFMKMMPRYNNISYNELWGNGQGGIILRCMKSNYNLIEHNNASDNYGSGIFIGGNNNTVRYNTVCNNKNGGPYYEDIGVGGRGYGINLGRSDGSFNNYLYNNEVCGNDYKDIYVVSGVTGNTGDENTCDTTYNYDDEGTTGCTCSCVPTPTPTPTPSPCFIATAAYGTPMHEDIDTLRKFRNDVLSTNTPGKALVETYYSTSPPIANALASNGCLRASVRVLLLTPLVYFASIMLNGSLFAPIIITACLAGLLYLYRTRKYGIFGGILKSAGPGILSIVVLSSLVFTLGWLGYTWSSCATIAAYILPLIIPISIAVVLIAVILPKYKNESLSSGGEQERR